MFISAWEEPELCTKKVMLMAVLNFQASFFLTKVTKNSSAAFINHYIKGDASKLDDDNYTLMHFALHFL